MIDNLNSIRNSFYSLKIYTNFKDFKYIFFCYPIKNKSRNLNLKILTKQVNYYYLKKLKTIRTISFMFPYLNNSIELYCTNDEKILKSLIQDINSNILFCKIDKNYYYVCLITKTGESLSCVIDPNSSVILAKNESKNHIDS